MRHRDGRRPTRPWGTVLLALTVAAGLSGCGGTMTGDDDLFERAREANATFKAAVSAVQAEISDDAWGVVQYGDVPRECGDGYAFRVQRTTPDGWRLSADAHTSAQSLGEWLGTHGWSDVQVRTYEGDVDNVVLQARKPDSGVDRLDVDFNPGTASDSVIVRADSTCQDGDPNELMAQLYPGWPTDANAGGELPETERPDATPIFGFTKDGSPR